MSVCSESDSSEGDSSEGGYCKGESSNGDSSEGESNDNDMITFFLSSLHQIYQNLPPPLLHL